LAAFIGALWASAGAHLFSRAPLQRRAGGRAGAIPPPTGRASRRWALSARAKSIDYLDYHFGKLLRWQVGGGGGGVALL